MAQDTAVSAPASGGRFEVSQEKFAELTEDRPADIQILDLKEALPDLFVKTDRIPRLVDRIWRRLCDETIGDWRGIYSHKGGTVVQVFFYELAAPIGKAKIALIRNKIPVLLKEAQADETILDVPLPVTNKGSIVKSAESRPNQDLAKILKEGFPINPTVEIAQMWAGRALQGMITAEQKIPITREMVDVVRKSDISYMPMWNAGGQAIVGSFSDIREVVPLAQLNAGEPLRLDLALLFGTVFQLYSMQSKGLNALAVVPVKISTLLDKGVGELYLALLSRLSADVSKNLIIEVRNASFSANSIAMVESISRLAKAYVFETSMLTYTEFGKHYPKLHACGFDSTDTRLGEQDQVRLIKKYGDYYQGAGLKTYIKNVTSPLVLEAAIRCGFAYISGPIVKPAQKTCFAAQKLLREEIGAPPA